MRLPEIALDDRRFQDLVSEARSRITRSCPEWTEHNVSDPGITLIELFAWMTEMLIYRLNRVPDKLHVTLLELLGIRLDPPSAATADVRFRLVAPPEDQPVEIPAGDTEVTTLPQFGETPIVFQVSESFAIPPMRPVAYAIQRGKQVKDVGVDDGTARPGGADQLPFGTPPEIGDALYAGFDEPLNRLVLALDVECSMARGAGVDPEDPPLRWEVSQGDGQWTEAEVLEDRTGGFNYGSGRIELQLPLTSGLQAVAGKKHYWVRCRLDDKTRSGLEGGATYQNAPEIYSLTAAPIGALLPSSHAVREQDEVIGISDGTPGQTFELRNTPVLQPRAGETIQVLDPDTGAWQSWELVETFVSSGPESRHFRIDCAHGEIEFGPAIRQPDGGWRQYGAIPPKEGTIRMTSYRHGGGREGNVKAGALAGLRSSVPGVTSVSNPRAAYGGVDAESLESARQRASLELRSRYRAVTAEDYEFLCGEASPRVARARCVAPKEGSAVAVHLLPRVDPADRKLEYHELVPDQPMLEDIASFLEERRLIGTTVHLLPVKFRGISVVVNLQASPDADVTRVEQDVSTALYTYLNPVVGGSPRSSGAGWPFGRALNQGELYGIVHAVEGVEYVKVLRIYEIDLATGEQASQPAGSHIAIEPDETIASGTHIVKATHRELG